MRRSLVNLKFIDDNYKKHHLYEITQLVNTFLGALIHPFEHSKSGEEFKRIFTNTPAPSYIGNDEYSPCENYYDFIRLIRNGLCHGHIKYKEGKWKNIESIEIWNKNSRGENFRCILSINDMKEILLFFSKKIEKIYKN